MALPIKGHDAILRARAGITLRTATARILAVWDRATPADIEAGATWYGDAGAIVSDLAGLCQTIGREHAASVISHLSPRTTWARNVAGATAMVTAYASGGDPAESARRVGCIAANVGRAERALWSVTPLDTFGPGAPKTRAFARNILGDRDAVTVDVWAARIALDPDWRRGARGEGQDAERALGRTGVYDAVAHAYRLAARAVGVDPTTIQATTWVVTRNGRAA